MYYMDGMDGWIDTGEVHLTADILSNTMYFRLRPCKIQRAFFLATVVCHVIIIFQPRAREYSTAKNTTQIRGYLPARAVESLHICCCLVLQDLLQSCSRGGRRIVQDMCWDS